MSIFITVAIFQTPSAIVTAVVRGCSNSALFYAIIVQLTCTILLLTFSILSYTMLTYPRITRYTMDIRAAVVV